MYQSTGCVLRFLSCLAAAACLFAQAKPGTDVLTFTDGEQLIGEFKSATGSKVVFKSNMGFEVTVEWSKIKELRSTNKYAAIPSTLTLKNGTDAGQVPQGAIDMTNQKLEVSSAPPQVLPVDKVSNVVQEPSFERALHHQSFLEGWKGGAAFGLAITDSTVSSQTVTSSLQISRSDPSESWMQVRNRTSVNFNSAYGNVTQPGSPSLKVSLYHADIEQDHYLSSRWFVLGSASFDHNIAQGLDLLQAYGGGVGAIVFKGEHSELDARGDVDFMKQTYSDSALNRNLVGSKFGETYTRTYARGFTLNEAASFRPAWNDMKDYYASFLGSMNMPVFHRLGVSLSIYDSYLNNPPPAFKRNSLQVSIGANYSFR